MTVWVTVLGLLAVRPVASLADKGSSSAAVTHSGEPLGHTVAHTPSWFLPGGPQVRSGQVLVPHKDQCKALLFRVSQATPCAALLKPSAGLLVAAWH